MVYVCGCDREPRAVVSSEGKKLYGKYVRCVREGAQ